MTQPNYYHKFGSLNGDDGYLNSIVPNQAVIDHLKGPRPLGGADYEAAIGYSYHLDAGLFAKYLREIAIKRGVRHFLDDVVNVELDENGGVSALQLKERGRYPVEFIIDCTGFRSLITEKALNEPFEPYGRYLLCDRAVAVQVPHKDPKRIEPCTTSTGINAGWVWKVPLYNRLGTGYVYSSAYLSDQEATDEFMQHLGDQGKGADPKIIRMRVGRSRRSWVKNCVAIGLSGGFVEPLEATAIFMIEMSIRWLLIYFPDKDFNPALADRFNKLVEGLYDEIRDFILMHYYTSNRTDTPFWIAARNEVEIPDSLNKNLELWKSVLPSWPDTLGNYLFQASSYCNCMYGKRNFDDITFPNEALLPKEDWVDYSNKLAAEKAELIRILPSHYDLLTQIRSKVMSAYQPPEALTTFSSPEVLREVLDQGPK